jgi:EAL domain-containing protein (putative c-di-GMP-specific phosphodiesterase class I)
MSCVVLDLGDLHRPQPVARTLGPTYVDGLVRSAERIVREVLGGGIRLFKVDTDCIAFLVPSLNDAAWRSVLQTLFERLRDPLDGDGLPGVITPRAGVIRVDSTVACGEALLRAATLAALGARAQDTPWLEGDISSGVPYRRLHAVLSGLTSAFNAADEFSLVYQPRIDLRSGSCLGVEALLRWRHPVLGNIPPGEFIPIAQQTGMVRFITDWVVERALSDLAAWLAAGFRQSVSINISALDLAEEGFASRLRGSISRHGVSPAMLELEFTEDALIRDGGPVRATIANLASAGIGIAIDDFGTGYSNLFYLREIPAKSLKIDQSFIRMLESSERDKIIVRSMIGLAHQLGYRVVAEGVETGEALAILIELGCDEGQGYHICRPLPIETIRAWWASVQ